ncbi:hypothetical protein OFC46_27625, partial [Escherichia coli]|nr:hypothetical protein [Escherichia coli]
NGIKIFAPTGQKLDDQTERLIEEDIFAARRTDAPISLSSDEAADRSLENNPCAFAEMRELYLQLLGDKAAGLRLEGLTVVLDC